jgi:hypothetical protein
MFAWYKPALDGETAPVAPVVVKKPCFPSAAEVVAQNSPCSYCLNIAAHHPHVPCPSCDAPLVRKCLDPEPRHLVARDPDEKFAKALDDNKIAKAVLCQEMVRKGL